MKSKRKTALCLITALLILTGCSKDVPATGNVLNRQVPEAPKTIAEEVSQIPMTETGEERPEEFNVPDYTGEPQTIVNGDKPYFTEEEFTLEPFEKYSELDGLGRCGVAYANICEELMPSEAREDIGMIKPSGWVQNKYPDLIKDNYLYNRCHLIAFMLAGENANEKNLITGTRYLNTEGMLPLEASVKDNISMTGGHVLYRVTPVFEGDDLVCRGVLMEALSVEDRGRSLSFCRFCHNVQPGIAIDYATGDNRPDTAEKETASGTGTDNTETVYIINTNSLKFHCPDCTGLPSPKNREESHLSREELIAEGYSPCGICHP